MKTCTRLSFALLLAAAGVLRAQCPPPTAPARPANGLVTTETRIQFAWTPAGSAVTGYDLLLSQNGGAPQVACSNASMPDCVVTLTPARYEWFVRSFVNGCPNGTDSPHSTFEIAGCSAPIAPSTLSPDATTTSANATLAWSGGAADTWDVFLEQGTACASTTPLNPTPLASAQTSFVTGTLTRGATYSWRVRASRGSTCPAPQFSRCATFSVRTCDPPGTATLTQPRDAATNVPSLTSLTWTTGAGATSYNIWSRTNASSAFALAGTTSSTSVNALFPPSTTVEWYVDAISGTCVTSSPHQTFTTAACGSSAPAAISPTGTLTPGAAIAFRWSAVSGADRYRIWLAPLDGAFDSIEETSDLTFTAHRSPGKYEWYVEAISNNCSPVKSAITQFVVPQSGSCATTPPTLLTPANGASVSATTTFTWTAVANAVRYEVWAALDDSAPALIGTTTVNTLTTDVAPGRIRWYVIALADGCNDLQSATSAFDATRTQTCASSFSPLLLAPADEAEGLPTLVDFFWTNVAGAQQYKLWVAIDDAPATVLATTAAIRAQASVPRGRISWFVEALFGSCDSRRSASSSFRSNAASGCSTPAAPSIYAPSGSPAGVSYTIQWTPQTNAGHYELLESTDQTIDTPAVLKTNDVSFTTSHDVGTAIRYHYRVRAVSSCGAGTGPLSGETFVNVTPSAAASSVQSTIPFGTGSPIVRTLFVPGKGSPVPFSASSDRPWLTITPSSGTLPANGITLTLKADLTALDPGDSGATVRIDTAGGKTSNATSVTTPVNVTLVTPIAPSGKTAATSSALILPAVAHLDGQATFHSDVRLANTGARPLRYQLTFTPSGTNATQSGIQTSLQVESGATVALNDLLQNFFGAAGATTGASGALEIKPLSATSDTAASPNVTFVSSRTFAVTASGTSGQFIPAIPLSRFAGSASNPLAAVESLLVPQISQSGAFRTNIGLVEASTQPAHVVLNFFNAAGAVIAAMPVDLQPGEHRQINGVVTSDNSLASAVRMQVNVTSATGLVTAYASVLDQRTNDPILVDAIPIGMGGAKHYVVPGVAALDAGGGNRWKSDMRIVNAGASSQSATLTFTPQGASAAPQSMPVMLAAGEERTLDDVVRATFGNANAGGSISVTTGNASSLAVTGRTYFDTGAGTYGQYIPAFTEGSGSGPGERAQQLLQIEQSEHFRTNLGLVELSGNPATVAITAYVPELKVSPTISINLAPNEFVQYGSVLTMMGVPTVYNARIGVKVTSGNGRVAGYASVIDNTSGDPTFVPSQ
jgi:hypothetical protein